MKRFFRKFVRKHARKMSGANRLVALTVLTTVGFWVAVLLHFLAVSIVFGDFPVVSDFLHRWKYAAAAYWGMLVGGPLFFFWCALPAVCRIIQLMNPRFEEE